MKDKNYLKKVINGLPEEKRNDVKLILKLAKVNPEVLDIALENTKNKELALNVMESNFDVIEKVSDELRNEPDFMLRAMDLNKKGIVYASDELKANKEFMLEAIKKNKNAYFEASEVLKEDDDILVEAVSTTDYAMEDEHEEVPEVEVEVPEVHEEPTEEVQEEVEEKKEEEPVHEEVVEPTFEEMLDQTENNPEIKAFDKNDFSQYTQPVENKVSNEEVYKNVVEETPGVELNPTTEENTQIEEYTPALDMLNKEEVVTPNETGLPVLDENDAINPLNMAPQAPVNEEVNVPVLDNNDAIVRETPAVEPELPGLNANDAITFDTLNTLGKDDQSLYNFTENQNYNLMDDGNTITR